MRGAGRCRSSSAEPGSTSARCSAASTRPPADPDFRRELAASPRARGGRRCTRAGRAEPALARGLHPNDEIRVVRALERLRAGSAVGEPQVRWR
jgi:tRNA A37 N6-isopentenylltransferase MiaA